MNFLVLFFDVNGTIVALDSAQEKTLEVTLLQELAKRIAARWHESLPYPISYTQFVRDYLLKGEEKSNLSLKKQRQERYASFLTYLHRHHPSIYEQVWGQFHRLQQVLASHKGHLFPSFIKLITQLNKRQIPFTLVLRSFGKDIPVVQAELAELDILIQHHGKFNGANLHLNGQQYNSPSQILSTLKKGQHHAWQDDWAYWHAHLHQANYGKPFYISTSHPLTLFFDDKIMEKDIIHLQPIDDTKMTKEEALAGGYLYAVDTLQAIEDTDYFCNRVFAKWKN